MAGVRVVHAIPGRVRLKVDGVKANPDLAEALEERLLALEGVQRVEVNPRTGSVLLLYDPSEREELGQVLQPLFPGLDMDAYRGVQHSSATNGNRPPGAPLGQRISGALGSLNDGMGRVTGGIDLKALLPLTLFALGIRSLLVSDNLRGPVWYDFFWFAFGTFLALNPIGSSDQRRLVEA